MPSSFLQFCDLSCPYLHGYHQLDLDSVVSRGKIVDGIQSQPMIGRRISKSFFVIRPVSKEIVWRVSKVSSPLNDGPASTAASVVLHVTVDGFDLIAQLDLIQVRCRVTQVQELFAGGSWKRNQWKCFEIVQFNVSFLGCTQSRSGRYFLFTAAVSVVVASSLAVISTSISGVITSVVTATVICNVFYDINTLLKL